jgi:septum site-determining protein MinC
LNVKSRKMVETITIKGTSDGLVITLGEGSFQAVLADLEKHLASRASFFLGGRIALRVGERPLSVEQLQTIGTIVQGMGVTLWAVEGTHPTTEVAARELGLEVHVRPAASSPQGTAEPISLEEMVGIVVRKTLRSGQSIQHAGHITLIGDVNPGAEVVAGGDVIVWGKLRGTVHAGAMGDDRAVVCALQLAPSQIRIAMHIARPPDRGRPPKVPEIASVQEDRIVVERWNKNR